MTSSSYHTVSADVILRLVLDASYAAPPRVSASQQGRSTRARRFRCETSLSRVCTGAQYERAQDSVTAARTMRIPHSLQLLLYN